MNTFSCSEFLFFIKEFKYLVKFSIFFVDSYDVFIIFSNCSEFCSGYTYKYFYPAIIGNFVVVVVILPAVLDY